MTTHVGHIIVGFDGSSTAQSAAEWAAIEAARRGCTLSVIGCYTAPLMNDFGMTAAVVPVDATEIKLETERQLDQVVDSLTSAHPRLSVAAEAVCGAPRHVLCERGKDADVLVVGATGASEVASLLLGSVAFAVSHTSPCPVVVVPSRHSASTASRVIVAIDTLDSSREAVDWAADEADLMGAELTVMHSWSYPYAMEFIDPAVHDLMEVDAACEMDRGIERARSWCGVDVKSRLDESDPAAAILAEAEGAALIVMGTRGRGSIRALFLGSTTMAVMTHASCPTVIVRHAR